MDKLTFTVPELISLVGVIQCVYILVYILFRSGRLSHAGLPFLYFLVLGTAFFLDLGVAYIEEITPYYEIIQWFLWFSGPPLSVLLVIQVVQITKLPALYHYWVLFLVPAALIASTFLSTTYGVCETSAIYSCSSLREWLIVSGLVAGAVSLLVIWAQRGLFDVLFVQKTGKDRYWLILALIFVNIFFLGAMFLSLTPAISPTDIGLIRSILGLGFVYLVTTSLFRIYPQAVRVVPSGDRDDILSNKELDVALQIEKLMELDKVYHETGYSRTDLARELDESETAISKIVNLHFGKSFPQLVNERRVADAKRLLAETDASIKVVAEEVGFNSLASFNRVFKDLAGEAPSAYRKNQIA
ncbi:MAG: hypothetical protein DHS20C02_02950 [Micavibrio sp.]|nr:MAG: hypothetical protein DHS20C02_02950 [Micavibrio sp.]